ncbi:cellulose synthase/poly-beta-1,6-N-acetylglucosamine synthase-like glycosyltransferase [Psychromicrobium silvestre]|uniref:Cellulose synthase/poly-beta-1,6-N-acetylglucosamine synthase-like glycosyltransferase n=1 Tax=Psychromicrobium silvestre TaxID=1645614 RepID=A0A7Y9LVX7_9MICC|nr:glycosyltransferase family 2 protein [Psychromicrobium silvestre]NYE96510.1 cellulose synthase/poly-beta-1,6-N-acetylglucosamine synthase-like glycosyltransferase [Psychromicrobium silvestre]
MSIFWAVTNGLATFVMAFSAAYFFLTVGMGLIQLRTDRTTLEFQSHLEYGRPFVAAGKELETDYTVFFIVACLNEEAVIGPTVTGLLNPAGEQRIVVIDDASDDATGEIAVTAGQGQVALLRRELPSARQGKGAALNAGFGTIVHQVREQRLDPTKVIVCVMDADGQLSEGALAEVLPLFDDAEVGGVQLAVRIRNRSTNFLLRFQDYQFWSQSALTQLGRVRTNSVSLGGNGQFARLSALLQVGERPWSGSLTEDLDLTVSLATMGWKTSSTPRAAVDQQGVEKFPALLKQRTRWYQGHMLTAKRIPEILRSARMGHAAAIEMMLYILVPWIFDLPWSILYHLVLIELALALFQVDFFQWGPASLVVYPVFGYFLGFWPALVTAVIAHRRDHTMTAWGALKMGHAFVITNYLSYACVWRALVRILRKEHGWTKTARTSEPSKALREAKL